MTPETTQPDDEASEQLVRRAERFRARGIPSEEIGYGAEPPEMTGEAKRALHAWESLSPANRRRTEVAAVYCPDCASTATRVGPPRALLTVHRVGGEFLAIPRSKRLTAHERNDYSEDSAVWGSAQPFVLGQAWNLVPAYCQCGFGRPVRGYGRKYIDLWKLVIVLNGSGQRSFVVGEPPL